MAEQRSCGLVRGMFLRTQHFQQQDRWIEAYVQGALAGLVGDGWGFRRLELNTGLLTTGQIGLTAPRAGCPTARRSRFRRADHPAALRTLKHARGHRLSLPGSAAARRRRGRRRRPAGIRRPAAR